MSFLDGPVKLERYSQNLRDQVNEYYMHAMNDPSMTQEEALRSTYEMAERSLEAVEEFQEAQNNQINVENENEVNNIDLENEIDNTEEDEITVGEQENTEEVNISEECDDGLDF